MPDFLEINLPWKGIMPPTRGYLHKYRTAVRRRPPGETPGYEDPPGGTFDALPSKRYKEVPYMVLLDFSEIDVTWLASKLSGAAVSLGAEALEMKNWIIKFGCDSEELREFIADQVD